jgi:hypothetical protein
MQEISESKSPLSNLDERERQSLTRIKEAEDLIEQNRRLIERSRDILASVPAA